MTNKRKNRKYSNGYNSEDSHDSDTNPPSKTNKIEESGGEQGAKNGNLDGSFCNVSSTDDNIKLSKLNCFTISKAIDKICPSVEKVKPLKNGSLLVKVKKGKDVEKFLKCRSMFDGHYNIRVTLADNLNKVKRVIYAEQLKMESEENILKYLKEQDVTEVRKLRKGPERKETNLIVLTFNKKELPLSIKAGYFNFKVRPYYHKPYQCYNCFKFGHGSDKCRNTDSLCNKCGEPGHKIANCINEFKCVNCTGDHKSTDKNCPKYLLEQEIIKEKIDKRISYQEARNIVRSRTATKI